MRKLLDRPTWWEVPAIDKALRSEGWKAVALLRLRGVFLAIATIGFGEVLRIGDEVVWDSLAICEVANERWLGGRAWPAEARARAFTASEKPWRDQRVAELTAPDGWTAVVGLHWIDRGSHYAGTAGSNGIRMAMGPEHFGMLDLGADGLTPRLIAVDTTSPATIS